EDMAELSELRGKSGSQNENYEERRVLEERVRKETEYRDRFMHRIRKARRKTYDLHEREEETDLFRELGLTEDNGEAADENDDNEDIIDNAIDTIDTIDALDALDDPDGLITPDDGSM
ncbi:MAG: hypothetical protein IK093_13260, partial [Ruminiclostridium sp.]|nr:hypothetical protein [Ruminiclostridium sp.]